MSPRGEYRLKVAGAMLGKEGAPPLDTLKHLRGLPQPQQTRIQAAVDWVEEYDSAEQAEYNFDV